MRPPSAERAGRCEYTTALAHIVPERVLGCRCRGHAPTSIVPQVVTRYAVIEDTIFADFGR